jgi:hypothetical protein
MCPEVHIVLGEGFFLNQNEKKNPIQWAHCPGITTVRHLHHRRRTTPPKERETQRET